jgi:hypothetical protein
MVSPTIAALIAKLKEVAFFGNVRRLRWAPPDLWSAFLKLRVDNPSDVG